MSWVCQYHKQKNVLKIMVTHFALGDQRKSSDLVIDLWCSIVSEHQKSSCSLCTGSHFDFVTYRFFFMYDVFALWYLSVQVFDFSSSCTQHQNRADTTQSFLRPKENYTLQVSQIRPIKHWNWYFLHWNARQIALIE